MKFRASFSILSAWAAGDYERVVASYFRLEKFVTPAMAVGLEWHQKWADHVRTNASLPPEFGERKLTGPLWVEEKQTVPLTEEIDLVWVADAFCEPVVFEWKTGARNSAAYADTKQLPLYGLGFTLLRRQCRRGEIYRLDPATGAADFSLVHLTDSVLREARDWAVTLGGQIHRYFLDNNFYDLFSTPEQMPLF